MAMEYCLHIGCFSVLYRKEGCPFFLFKRKRLCSTSRVAVHEVGCLSLFIYLFFLCLGTLEND